MRKLLLFLTIFFIPSMIYAAGVGSVSGGSPPLKFRTQDLSISSYPTTIQFPNGSISFSTVPTSTMTISFVGSALGSGSTIYATFSDVASATSSVSGMSSGATYYLNTDTNTSHNYNLSLDTMTISSITVNYFNAIISTNMSKPILISSTAGGDVFYVKLTSSPNYTPRILLKEYTSIGSTINYGYPLQVGAGNDKTSDPFPYQITMMVEQMGTSAVNVRDAKNNQEVYLAADSLGGHIGTETNSLIDFKPNNSRKMLLATAGNLSITDTTNGTLTVGGTFTTGNPAFYVLTGSASIQSKVTNKPTGLQVGSTNFIVAKGGAGVSIGTVKQNGVLTVNGTQFGKPILWVGSTNSVTTSNFEVGFTSAQIKNNVYVDSITVFGTAAIGTVIPVNKFTIQGNSGSGVSQNTFAGDGDGTDDVYNIIYGYGTPSDYATNRDRLLMGYDSGDSNYQIWVEREGAGTLRDLVLYTEGNSNQLVISASGNIGIGTVSPRATLEVSSSVYIGWTCSADSYIDRTPYPKTPADAWKAIESMKIKEDLSGLNHEALDSFVQAKQEESIYDEIKNSTSTIVKVVGRDLSATVSCLVETIKDLKKRIDFLENK